MIPLLQALATLGDQYEKATAERREIEETAALAEPHITPVLAMRLWAECARRGVDWHRLLADAVRAELAAVAN